MHSIGWLLLGELRRGCYPMSEIVDYSLRVFACQQDSACTSQFKAKLATSPQLPSS